ncbi:MAG: hypothetical protein K2W82_14620 [Candidatus Obscuribacterales bacterium]|nr:hypothetical protein [Candidatus Obscuribacterales bacterium]
MFHFLTLLLTAFLLAGWFCLPANSQSPATILNDVVSQSDSLRKACKSLDQEMNRHAEIAVWNGVFGEPNMGYDEYSTFDTEPIGPGLASTTEEGPLLPPNDITLNKWLKEIGTSNKNLFALLASFQLPANASHESSAQWQVLANTNSSFQDNLNKLSALLAQDSYDQKDAAKLTSTLANEASGMHEIAGRLGKLIRKP